MTFDEMKSAFVNDDRFKDYAVDVVVVIDRLGLTDLFLQAQNYKGQKVSCFFGVRSDLEKPSSPEYIRAKDYEDAATRLLEHMESLT